MSKDISTIKCGNKINFPQFLLSPRMVTRNFVDIERFKNDPGAAYITIRTVGGISAILRYAYEGAALEGMRKDSEYAGYELVTASDTMKVIIGNYKHDEKTEKGTEALMDMLFKILMTCNYPMTTHTKDGFMLLASTRNGPFNYGRHNDNLPEKGEDYDADIKVNCYHIREKDEAIIALISAINLWGNRVGVTFNIRYYKDRYDVKPSVAREIFANAAVTDLFANMEKMKMNSDSLDVMASELAFAIVPVKAGIPHWEAFGASDTGFKDDEDY
ncbi:hypothetical protein [uncultured Duncaniella sp.]|uniref:hypothetical protein n=1 Tax=uncultured Duncaniella sp. TaxID=2768039 RepID=UPI00260F39C7|nr:hypothetical protein [uncultured Duncaniella sp.]